MMKKRPSGRWRSSVPVEEKVKLELHNTHFEHMRVVMRIAPGSLTSWR